MVEFKTDESAFNFALKYLESIHNSLRMCEQMATVGSVEGWISWLRIAYRELSAKTNPNEDKEFDKDFKQINILINNPKIRKTKRNYICYLLDNLERKIRKKLQQKGMLLPSKEDPFYAVLKR